MAYGEARLNRSDGGTEGYDDFHPFIWKGGT